MRQYLEHFRGSWGAISLLAVLLALSGLLPAAAVWCLAQALDGVLEQRAIQGPLIGLVAVAGAQGAIHVLRSVGTRTLGWAMVHRLRLATHERLLELPAQGRLSVGSRLSALSHESDELQFGVSAFVTAARNPVMVVGLIAVAVWMAPELAWRFVLVAPLLVLPAWLGGRWVRRQAGRWRDAREALICELQDQHAGLDTLIDLGAQKSQFARAEALSQDDAKARARLEWMRTVPTAAVQLAVAIAVVAILLWGSPLVAKGQITAGALVGFAASMGLLQRPISGLTEVWTLLSRSLAALARVEALLAEEPPKSTPCRPGPIVLDGATVMGRLHPVSLRFEAGEKVALVGPSGAGKSTLLGILAGHLFSEGVTRAPAQLLRQDPWVFDRTAAGNLRLGRPEATDAELMEALDSVDLTLKRGLEGRVGERGCLLSGGERQRLCLARALLSRPAVLLLDEATSEVDPARARRVALQLTKLDATVIFACHDEHFAGVADRVITLDCGRVISDVRRREAS